MRRMTRSPKEARQARQCWLALAVMLAALASQIVPALVWTP